MSPSRWLLCPQLKYPQSKNQQIAIYRIRKGQKFSFSICENKNKARQNYYKFQEEGSIAGNKILLNSKWLGFCSPLQKALCIMRHRMQLGHSTKQPPNINNVDLFNRPNKEMRSVCVKINVASFHPMCVLLKIQTL